MGREVSFLCLFDLDAGSLLDFMPSNARKFKSAQLLAQRVIRRAINFINSDSKQRKEYIQAFKKNNANQNENELESWLDKHNMAEMIGEESASYFRKVEEACYESLQGYKLKRYNGDVLLVRAKDGYFNNTYSNDLGWSHYVSGKVDVQIAPGDHNSIFWEPFVFELSKIVDDSLRKANQPSLKAKLV
jgi:thioesterase domain-containing protein